MGFGLMADDGAADWRSMREAGMSGITIYMLAWRMIIIAFFDAWRR